MAEGILGLGGGGAASLNQETIDKLKEAERKARVEPIERDIESLTGENGEREVYAQISAKVDELLAAVKPFDLFVTGGTTAFDEKVANTSGTSVVFSAVDVSKLNNGVTTVNIDSLAQKDVYQSNTFNAATKDALGDIGTLTIQVGTETHNFNTADYTTYDELAAAIDATTGINASVDQVGTDSYRLVLKSEESGLANALTISGTASQALGYTTDGTTINATNQLLTAQDMKAFVDGVEYNVSGNELTVDGLKVSATSTGESKINISNDDTVLQPMIQEFITKYNELVDLVDGELQKDDSPINDRTAMRDLLSQVKSHLFGSYGANDDQSIFNYGFELDKTGKLSLDSTKFSEAVENNLDNLKDLFIGTAAKEGLGTQLKATIDEMNFSGGVLDSYEDRMDSRQKTLEEELKKAEDSLNSKYEQLALQFGSYGAIINGFEASFSGLKMMIQQSTSSN